MLATGGIGMIALLIGMPSDGAAQRLFQPVIVQALVAKVVG
jgi:hypothetical protein